MRRVAFTFGVVVALASAVHAAEPSRGLHLRLPVGWTESSVPVAQGKPPAFEVTAPGTAGALRIKIQTIPLPQGKLAPDVVRGIVDKMVAKALQVSAETELMPAEVTGNSSGYVFTCTSRSQKGPADQQYVTTSAFVQTTGLAMAVSMSHRRGAKDLNAALDVIRTATCDAPATQPATPPAP